MQTPLLDLNDSEKRLYRKWTIAFTLIYGAVFVTFVCLVFIQAPYTESDVAKADGIEATGSINLAAKKRSELKSSPVF